LEQAGKSNSRYSSAAGTHKCSIALCQSIFEFYEVQNIYMSGALEQRLSTLAELTDESRSLDSAQYLPIILPSDLLVAMRKVGCICRVTKIEEQYANARMRGALCNIWRYQRIFVAIRQKLKHQINSECFLFLFADSQLLHRSTGQYMVEIYDCWSYKKTKPCRCYLPRGIQHYEEL
jgi:hypothetical protein